MFDLSQLVHQQYHLVRVARCPGSQQQKTRVSTSSNDSSCIPGGKKSKISRKGREDIIQKSLQRRVERDVEFSDFAFPVTYSRLILCTKRSFWGSNFSCRNCMTILFNAFFFFSDFLCSGWSFEWSGQTSSQRRFSEPIDIHKTYHIGPNCCEIHILGSIQRAPWALCKVHLVCEPLETEVRGHWTALWQWVVKLGSHHG